MNWGDKIEHGEMREKRWEKDIGSLIEGMPE